MYSFLLYAASVSPSPVPVAPPGDAAQSIGPGFAARPPVTMLVVHALAMPGQLIELEATAVLA